MVKGMCIILKFINKELKELFYHELYHAALGNAWYTTFLNAEITEIISNMSLA